MPTTGGGHKKRNSSSGYVSVCGEVASSIHNAFKRDDGGAQAAHRHLARAAAS
eukprot:COSAG05_NODE_21461_length_271_cov_2.069767_1_plen_52_part_10